MNLTGVQFSLVQFSSVHAWVKFRVAMSTLEADVGEGQVSYNSWRRSDLQAMRGSRLPYVTVPCAAVKPCVGAIVLLRVAAIERLCYISQHCQSSNGTGRAR